MEQTPSAAADESGSGRRLDDFLRRHRLPTAFRETVRRYYVPLADWLEKKLAPPHEYAFVLGINGAQGTGKSTLAAFLTEYLEAEHGRRAAVLSIDDLYLTRPERERLADEVHPLLLTRGVPGTHDVGLGVSVIERLRTLADGQLQRVPRFDKAGDDRAPEASWPDATGPLDLVVLEGWCVASRPEPDASLTTPVNALERSEDPDGRWRRYVNEQLRTVYPALFDYLDALVFLEAPGFAAIRRWRLEQEHKLRDATADSNSRVMSDDEVMRFIEHFERITRNNLQTLPAASDIVLQLDDAHQVTSMNFS